MVFLCHCWYCISKTPNQRNYEPLVQSCEKNSLSTMISWSTINNKRKENRYGFQRKNTTLLQSLYDESTVLVMSPTKRE